MRRFFRNISWVFPLLGGVIAFTLYFLIKYIPYGVDIKIHNFYLVEYLEKGHFPIPPGYYALIYLVDLFFRFKYPFVLSSILILTFFLLWKFSILRNWISSKPGLPRGWGDLLALGLMFFGPWVAPWIETDFWYLGKFTPTIWHNSTLIVSLPFSLLLFRETLDWWENETKSSLWKILLFGLLILLIKPSFLFCFVPLFPWFTGKLKGFSSLAFRFSLGIALGLLIGIAAEKFLIYSWDPMVVEEYPLAEQPQIQIRPFKVWLHYAFEPVWDFISSFMLSITFLILWGKSPFSRASFSFSFSLLILSLILFLTLSESGFREWHANFYWQIPIALLIHCWAMLDFVLDFQGEKGKKLHWKTKVFGIIFGLHVLFGLAYWGRFFVERIIS
ncbi:MAG: hypothetical protein LPK25_08200 [Cyclobacteriaceae bacterium]|nr:hypothetical protein [Cyclobacteriaceae bacterium]